MAEDRVTELLRSQVAERAHYLCEYCRMPEAYSLIPRHSAEHIIPRSLQGETSLDNLAYSCQGCNGHKATRTEGVDAATGHPAPLFDPRKHRWNEHFRWSDDSIEIVGLTPEGRATVDALRLNREGLRNLRRVLIPWGEHPPPEPQ
jgi:hypothetical protein